MILGRCLHCGLNGACRVEAPKSKAEFRGRYLRGEFGNKPSTWKDAGDLDRSGFTGTVTARSAAPGGPCHYRVPVVTATTMSGYVYNESMPDEKLLVQGEVFRDNGGLRLTYNTTPGLTMRDAMRSPKNATGLVASMILRKYLWPSSYDDVMTLLDDYDGVVEFGAYAGAVGDCPHRNTVIWEVRNY